jgi:hypothetical protein
MVTFEASANADREAASKPAGRRDNMTADNSGNSMSSPLGMTNVEVVDTVDTVDIEAALDEILQTVTNLFSFFFPI